jgi:hypothetical protein
MLLLMMHSGHIQTCIPVWDFFGEIDKVVSSIFTQSEQTFFPCFHCIGNSEDKNLTSPQRELLLWHWKLSINMYRVQKLMCERTFEEPLGKRKVLPPIIKPNSLLLGTLSFWYVSLASLLVPGTGLPK